LETETVFFAKLCVRLGELCGFALSSSLTAKYAKDFARSAKQTAPLPDTTTQKSRSLPSFKQALYNQTPVHARRIGVVG
jgi:hypothetical protein